MWFRRLTGTLLGMLILALGLFLSYDELRGPEPARWWYPVLAVLPGALILGVTWITWAAPKTRHHRTP